MVRFSAAIFCMVPVGCFGQVADLDRQLASGEPRDVAWAAYTVGVQERLDMVPKLVGLVVSYKAEPTADAGRISPSSAVMEAVADALIRVKARLPADVVMHLYPQFPAQTIILLSRASDNTGPLLEIFQTTKSRDLWLAAGNLLAVHPPPGFVRLLLFGAVATFSFRVVLTEPQKEEGVGEGCASDSMMLADENFRGWPKARMYRITHGEPVQNIFAPGIHAVGFSWWETTDYKDAWEDGDCSKWTSKYWRTGLLAQLLGKKVSDFPLEPDVGENQLFTSTAAFEDQVRSTIQQKRQAFREVIEAFIQNGNLTVQDSAAFQLRCKIQVMDYRPLPRADLPDVVGRWCSAPLADADSRLP